MKTIASICLLLISTAVLAETTNLYTAAEIAAIKTYTVSEVQNQYKEIGSNTVIRVKFNHMPLSKRREDGSYLVYLSDEEASMYAIVSGEGKGYQDRIEKDERSHHETGNYGTNPIRYMYCTVVRSGLVYKLTGTDASEPVLRCLGTTTTHQADGKEIISW